MKRKIGKQTLVDFILLLGLTAVFGLLGGTVYYHPDEVIDEAIRALINHGNPEYFHYPALGIYLQAVYYGCILLISSLAGLRYSRVTLDDLLQDPSFPGAPLTLQAPGHMLNVCLSLLGVLCVYWIVRRLTRMRVAALLAGAYMATSLLWVRNSHYVTVDILLASLSVATAAVALHVFSRKESPSLRQLLMVGGMVGLTTSAKYNGALAAVMVALPLLFLFYRQPGLFFKRSLWCALAALVVFFITNPYIVLDFPLFYEHFSSRVTELNEGRAGFQMSNGWVYHIVYSLGEGYGILGMLSAATGIIWLICTRRIASMVKVILMSFPILFFGIMGGAQVAFPRHILPMIPFLAVFSGLGAAWLLSLCHRRSQSPICSRAVGAILCLSLLPQATASLQHNRQLQRGDTRTILETIYQRSALPWSEIQLYCGRYTKMAAVQSGIKPEIFLAGGFSIFPAHDPLYRVHQVQPEVLVFDSFSHDRLLDRPPERRPAQPFNNHQFLILTPYKRPGSEVPVAMESIYSPFPPDLSFRQQSGPYIELYFRDPELAGQMQSVFRDIGIPAELHQAEEGRFYTYFAPFKEGSIE